MNLEPLHDKLNREHPRFSAHLTFAERDAIVRTIIHSIGDVAPDVDTAPRATGSEKPVAWRYRWRNTTPSGDADAWSYTDTQPAPDSAMLGVLRKDIEPLYDHPSPSLASATAPEKQERCGECAFPLIPRRGEYFPCVLPKGHDGEHRGGGTCVVHGEYVGEPNTPPQCPQWPACAENLMPPAAPPAASATAGDWRESEAVSRIRSRILMQMPKDRDESLGDMNMLSLDALCDAVQSHARAASPPVPESPSPEKKS